ncbi:MAG: peroxiredoxin-like family protein [Thermoleophilia bacterium]
MQVRAYQAVLPELRTSGATLVAVSPELPDNSLTFQEKNALEFEVLTDAGNVVADAYGLGFELDEAARRLFLDVFRLDLAGWNVDGSWRLPIPASYVIAPDSTIRYAFVDPDYTRRAEPQAILEAVRSG